MKPKMLVKLFFSALMGALFGGSIAVDHSRWFHLGRDAFMANQARRFDMYMSRPSTGVVYVVATAIFAVGLAAIYELVAIAGDKLLKHLSGHEEVN